MNLLYIDPHSVTDWNPSRVNANIHFRYSTLLYMHYSSWYLLLSTWLTNSPQPMQFNLSFQQQTCQTNTRTQQWKSFTLSRIRGLKQRRLYPRVRWTLAGESIHGQVWQMQWLPYLDHNSTRQLMVAMPWDLDAAAVPTLPLAYGIVDLTRLATRLATPVMQVSIEFCILMHSKNSWCPDFVNRIAHRQSITSQRSYNRLSNFILIFIFITNSNLIPSLRRGIVKLSRSRWLPSSQLLLTSKPLQQLHDAWSARWWQHRRSSLCT